MDNNSTRRVTALIVVLLIVLMLFLVYSTMCCQLLGFQYGFLKFLRRLIPQSEQEANQTPSNRTARRRRANHNEAGQQNTEDGATSETPPPRYSQLHTPSPPTYSTATNRVLPGERTTAGPSPSVVIIINESDRSVRRTSDGSDHRSTSPEARISRIGSPSIVTADRSTVITLSSGNCAVDRPDDYPDQSLSAFLTPEEISVSERGSSSNPCSIVRYYCLGETELGEDFDGNMKSDIQKNHCSVCGNRKNLKILNTWSQPCSICNFVTSEHDNDASNESEKRSFLIKSVPSEDLHDEVSEPSNSTDSTSQRFKQLINSRSGHKQFPGSSEDKSSQSSEAKIPVIIVTDANDNNYKYYY